MKFINKKNVSISPNLSQKQEGHIGPESLTYTMCTSQTFSTYQILKALSLVVSNKRVFSCFPRWASVKHVTPGWGNFVPEGQNFDIHGRGQLGNVT